MKSQSVLLAALSFLAVACGGPQDKDLGADATGTQEAALTRSIVGTWCHASWPGCFAINASGDGYMVNNGDGCWRNGDLVFTGLVASSTPDTYTGTRLMYGSGVCGYIAPQSDTLTMTDDDHFTEVTSGGFSTSWYRVSP
jgi:hypothetical protein